MPGSPSSMLIASNLGEGWSFKIRHFFPAGKPAPPRPRKLEFSSSVKILSPSTSLFFSLLSNLYPPSFMYSSMLMYLGIDGLYSFASTACFTFLRFALSTGLNFTTATGAD